MGGVIVTMVSVVVIKDGLVMTVQYLSYDFKAFTADLQLDLIQPRPV